MNRLTQICLTACIFLITAVSSQTLEFTVQGRLLDNGGAVAIQIFRNGVVAGDTYGSDVEVLGLRIDHNTDPEAF
jgi:hypothetical protein